MTAGLEGRSTDFAESPMPRARPGDGTRPFRFLVVVDGSERTNRIVSHVAAMAPAQRPIEAVVLNVQTKRDDARLRGYQTFKQQDIDDRLVNELGRPIVNSASRRLDKAGIRTLSRIEIGDPVLTVLQCAKEEDCDAIVIGAPALPDVCGWIMKVTGLALGASTAMHLAARATMPVVVVK